MKTKLNKVRDRNLAIGGVAFLICSLFVVYAISLYPRLIYVDFPRVYFEFPWDGDHEAEAFVRQTIANMVASEESCVNTLVDTFYTYDCDISKNPLSGKWSWDRCYNVYYSRNDATKLCGSFREFGNPNLYRAENSIYRVKVTHNPTGDNGVAIIAPGHFRTLVLGLWRQNGGKWKVDVHSDKYLRLFTKQFFDQDENYSITSF